MCKQFITYLFYCICTFVGLSLNFSLQMSPPHLGNNFFPTHMKNAHLKHNYEPIVWTNIFVYPYPFLPDYLSPLNG